MTEQQLTFYQKVSKIQAELNAPKNAFNAFGKYKYRNLESILESLKPHLDKHELFLTLNDEIVKFDNPQGIPVASDVNQKAPQAPNSIIDSMRCRYYIKATATISDGAKELSTFAYAREELSKKGMDASQLTGSCSSYARKYALGGLFAIDDNKDADSRDNTESKQIKRKVKSSEPANQGKENILADLTSKVSKLQSIQEANSLWVAAIGHVQGGDLERADISDFWNQLEYYCDMTFQASYDKQAKQFIVNEGATFQ
jgi:hypothetical protein